MEQFRFRYTWPGMKPVLQVRKEKLSVDMHVRWGWDDATPGEAERFLIHAESTTEAD